MPRSHTAQTQSCFLSYARTDEQFALRFANDLRSRGAVMWVDQLDIRPREHWDRAIERAIRGCGSFVVILSPRAVASNNVADEISLAIDSGKSVIPVMIEACALPLRLARLHLIDATRGYDAALRQCLAEIKGHNGTSGTPSKSLAEFCGIDDAEALDAAKHELASIIGPIAGILVDRAATRAATVEGLYGLLALNIHNEDDRQRFVASRTQYSVAPADAPAPEPSQRAADAYSISGKDLDRVAAVLTNFLGPIAPFVTRKESKAARSLQDLLPRLAAKLPNDCDRADFLGQLRSAVAETSGGVCALNN
jgi:hypothetical protein